MKKEASFTVMENERRNVFVNGNIGNMHLWSYCRISGVKYTFKTNIKMLQSRVHKKKTAHFTATHKIYK